MPALLNLSQVAYLEATGLVRLTQPHSPRNTTSHRPGVVRAPLSCDHREVPLLCGFQQQFAHDTRKPVHKHGLQNGARGDVSAATTQPCNNSTGRTTPSSMNLLPCVAIWARALSATSPNFSPRSTRTFLNAS